MEALCFYIIWFSKHQTAKIPFNYRSLNATLPIPDSNWKNKCFHFGWNENDKSGFTIPFSPSACFSYLSSRKYYRFIEWEKMRLLSLARWKKSFFFVSHVWFFIFFVPFNLPWRLDTLVRFICSIFHSILLAKWKTRANLMFSFRIISKYGNKWKFDWSSITLNSQNS